MSERLASIRYLDRLRMRVRFQDGAENDVDFAEFLSFRGELGRPLRDPKYFAKAFIDPEAGVVTWPNGYDVCNTVLYSKVTGRTIRSLLNPAPARVRRHAKPRRRVAAR
jgi:hypothetical protein